MRICILKFVYKDISDVVPSRIEVFGCNEEETIYTGLAEDVPNNIGAMEILSIDTLYTPTTTITLNVND